MLVVRLFLHKPGEQQIISLLLISIVGFQMFWPMCYIWEWTKPIDSLDRFLSKCTDDRFLSKFTRDVGKAKGIFTVTVY